jgi:hypothetical protein
MKGPQGPFGLCSSVAEGPTTSKGDVLQRADDEVTQWAASVVGDVRVTLGPPISASDYPVVCLHLLELADTPPARGVARAPLQVSVRYLVTTAAKDAWKAHELLGGLLFAAMERTDFETRLDGIPSALWTSSGVPPRGAFVVSLTVRVEQPARPTRFVKEPLLVKHTPFGPLEGLVLGPGDVPVADAFVRLPQLAASTRSDNRGRFRFAAFPFDVPTDVLVSAKASEFPFTIDSPPDSEPVVLRLDLSEN